MLLPPDAIALCGFLGELELLRAWKILVSEKGAGPREPRVGGRRTVQRRRRPLSGCRRARSRAAAGREPATSNGVSSDQGGSEVGRARARLVLGRALRRAGHWRVAEKEHGGVEGRVERRAVRVALELSADPARSRQCPALTESHGGGRRTHSRPPSSCSCLSIRSNALSASFSQKLALDAPSLTSHGRLWAICSARTGMAGTTESQLKTSDEPDSLYCL